MHCYTCINALAQGISRPNAENCTGGGGTLIIPYRLGPFFWVQNLEFQFLWGFQKNEYFLWYEDFVDMGGGCHHKN